VVEVVRDVDRFHALAPEWDGLVERWGIDRLFLSHVWFRTWWDSFGAGNELFIVTVRHGGELIGIAPMMRTRVSIYGWKLNALQAIFNPHTPRYDFIVGRNRDPAIYRAIWTAFLDHGAADAIVLTQIPDGSKTIAEMERLAQKGTWLTGQWSAPASPFVRLDGSYDSLFGKLRDSVQYNLRKRFDRLNRKGPVDVEFVTGVEDVGAAMADGLRIEAAAWKGAEGTAIISDPTVASFYVRLAERQAKLGQLRLGFLRVGGKRVAFNYLLRCGTKLYALKIGYDPEYHSYSPGHMLLNLILEHACNEQVQEYDFLGNDDDWKFEWTEEKREHRWLFLLRNRLPNRLLHHLKFSLVPAVKPRIKKISALMRGET
jgi:CelD/BcsL family acetyltransferase involved in cellulose biosynthesis